MPFIRPRVSPSDPKANESIGFEGLQIPTPDSFEEIIPTLIVIVAGLLVWVACRNLTQIFRRESQTTTQEQSREEAETMAAKKRDGRTGLNARSPLPRSRYRFFRTEQEANEYIAKFNLEGFYPLRCLGDYSDLWVVTDGHRKITNDNITVNSDGSLSDSAGGGYDWRTGWH